MKQFHIVEDRIYDTTGLSTASEVSEALGTNNWYGVQADSFQQAPLEAFRLGYYIPKDLGRKLGL